MSDDDWASEEQRVKAYLGDETLPTLTRKADGRTAGLLRRAREKVPECERHSFLFKIVDGRCCDLHAAIVKLLEEYGAEIENKERLCSRCGAIRIDGRVTDADF